MQIPTWVPEVRRPTLVLDREAWGQMTPNKRRGIWLVEAAMVGWAMVFIGLLLWALV